MRFRSLDFAALTRILEHFGYVAARQRGSHVRFVCDGRRSLTIARRKDVFPPGTVKKILMQDAGLTEEELNEFFG